MPPQMPPDAIMQDALMYLERVRPAMPLALSKPAF
jgi:hypothetical protein